MVTHSTQVFLSSLSSIQTLTDFMNYNELITNYVLCMSIGYTRCDKKPGYLFIGKKNEVPDDGT